MSGVLSFLKKQRKWKSNNLKTTDMHYDNNEDDYPSIVGGLAIISALLIILIYILYIKFN
jgi:hypothetical protein